MSTSTWIVREWVGGGIKEVKYPMHKLADCWADHRDADGTIVANKSHFPE